MDFCHTKMTQRKTKFTPDSQTFSGSTGINCKVVTLPFSLSLEMLHLIWGGVRSVEEVSITLLINTKINSSPGKFF